MGPGTLMFIVHATTHDNVGVRESREATGSMAVAHRLIGRDHRRHRPRADHLGDLPGLPLEPGLGILDPLPILRQDNLSRRMAKSLLAQPARMRLAPNGATAEDPTMEEKIGPQVLSRTTQRLHRRLARSRQLTHRLMNWIRHPDWREIASMMRLGGRHRVPPVRLDAFARSLRDQRRGDDDALMAKRDNLAVQTVAGRPRLIAKAKFSLTFRQPVHYALNRRRGTVDVAEEPQLPVATGLGKGHGNLTLRGIQTNKNVAILVHGSSSLCVMPYADPSAATLAHHIPRGRATRPAMNIRSRASPSPWTSASAGAAPRTIALPLRGGHA